MATKQKSKANPKTKAAAKKAKPAKAAPVKKPVKKAAPKAAARKSAPKVELKAKTAPQAKPASAPARAAAAPAPAPKPAASQPIRRTVNPARRPILKKNIPQRGAQFDFMRPPGAEYHFEVGDIVEVFCDHEKNRDRIRGWVKGIIVQVDHKLAAVQFRSNVYLTDGWMVPDRILWFPVNSEHIRPVASKKPVEKKTLIPDY